MARNYLSKEQEKWLFENFSTMSNEELAAIVSERMEKENKKKIEELTEVLKMVPQKRIRKSIAAEIEWRKSFKGVSASYIKYVGRRLKCTRKSNDYLSTSHKERARSTNIKKWMKTARIIKDPALWLSTFRASEVRVCRVQSHAEMRRMRNAIFYFNRLETKRYGFFFASEHIKEAGLLRVFALTDRERRKACQG